MAHDTSRRVWIHAVLIAVGAGFLALSARSQPANPPAARRQTEHSVEAYLSNDAIQALYIRQADAGDLGEVELHAGVFFNEQRDLIAIADALSASRVGDRERRIVFQFGPRAYAAFLNEENQDIFSIGVGGIARYFFGRDRATSVAVNAYYAPDITTFGTADNIVDLGVRLETELNDGMDVFVGYRLFEIDIAGGPDRDVDDHLHLGFRRSF